LEGGHPQAGMAGIERYVPFEKIQLYPLNRCHFLMEHGVRLRSKDWRAGWIPLMG